MKPDKSAGLFGRARLFAFYDWTRDMRWTRRWLTVLALVIQAAALSTALLGVQSGILGPKKVAVFLIIGVTYVLALLLMNGMLTSEFIRKTQLEADQIAAEQIQRTLHPQKLEELPGYRIEMFCKPLRGVGGDYFDVIELPNNQVLFAVADVSGKGMPAACCRQTFRHW